jgi:hypothetical protein
MAQKPQAVSNRDFKPAILQDQNKTSVMHNLHAYLCVLQLCRGSTNVHLYLCDCSPLMSRERGSPTQHQFPMPLVAWLGSYGLHSSNSRAAQQHAACIFLV